MRVAFSVLLVLGLCFALTASATSLKAGASVFTTTWSKNIGLTQDSVLVADKEVIFIGKKDKVEAFNATNGDALYTIPTPARFTGMNAIVKKLNVDPITSTIFVTFGPKTQNFSNPQPEVLYSYLSANGNKVWEMDVPMNAQVTAHGRSSLLFGEMTTTSSGNLNGMRFLVYNLADGTLSLNTTTTVVGVALGGGVGDSVFAISGAPPTGGELGAYVFNLNTGAFVCHVEEFGFVEAISFSGDSFIGEKNGTQGVINGSTCSIITDVPPGQKAAMNGESFYTWQQATNKVSRYNRHGMKTWSTAILPTRIEGFFAVTNTAFNPDAVIVNNQGTFTALNKTSGAIMWNTTTVVPFGPASAPADQQVYPLGNSMIFVPNLQGYIVLEQKDGGVVKAIDERSPIKGTWSFKHGGKPVVVYGDLNSGSLIAIQRS